MEIEKAEGSPSGPVIWFANNVAEAIAEEFPDLLIHTFAYQYTRTAPKNIKPHKNVIVRLCTIECCFSHPLDGRLPQGSAPIEHKHEKCQCGTQGETLFMKDLREWSRICDRLYIWDYVTNFRNYLMPFPNFAVLKTNLQIFRDLGVKGVLEQGDFAHGGGGHFAELQAYLQSKLMWNPDADMDTCMDEFIAGYYGTAAAPKIREYIELFQRAAAPWHMNIYEPLNAPFITNEALAQADRLLNEAVFLTADPDIVARIQRLQLGLTQIILARIPLGTPGRDILIDRFGWQLRSHGISEIRERWPLQHSLDMLRSFDPASPETGPLPRADYKM